MDYGAEGFRLDSQFNDSEKKEPQVISSRIIPLTGLYVLDHGMNRPKIVFIHGAMDRARSFSGVMRELHPKRTVAYDRRGYGRSRNLRPEISLSIESNVKDLKSVIEDEDVILVGHSFGGVIALCAAQASSPQTSAVKDSAVNISSSDPNSTQVGPTANITKTNNKESNFFHQIKGIAIYEMPQPWTEFWQSAGQTPGSLVRSSKTPAEAVDSFMSRMLGQKRWNDTSIRVKEDRRSEGKALIADLSKLYESKPFNEGLIEVPVLIGYGSRSSERHQLGANYLASKLKHSKTREFKGGDHQAHRKLPKDFARFVNELLDLLS